MEVLGVYTSFVTQIRTNTNGQIRLPSGQTQMGNKTTIMTDKNGQ